MIATLIVFSIINLLLLLLLIVRSGRIILIQNDQADLIVQAHNAQIKGQRKVEEAVENALDCLLTLDYKSQTITGQDVSRH